MDSATLTHKIFLSYYGDDFTGSSDVMESLALNGIPTALFLEAPEKHEVENFQLKVGVGADNEKKTLKAFGVAGLSRSWSPEEMDNHLPGIFEKISKIPVDFFQLKVCSTFDSSPQIGNIGHTVEIALKYFPSDYIPLIVGAPFLNRFIVFGNLFARVGDQTFRLDRHPTMSRHPVTPMQESDLRKHLSLQTKRKIKLIDIFGLNGNYGPVVGYFRRFLSNRGEFVLFDTLTREHLLTIGKILIENKSSGPQFFVGASGADYALAFYLQRLGRVKSPAKIEEPGRAARMVVLAGSCSPATAGQIKYLESLGHLGIRMDSVKLIQPIERGQEIKKTISKALRVLEKGRVPLVFTAKGPDDPYLKKTRTLLHQTGGKFGKTGDLLAVAQGQVLEALIEKLGKMRVVVAGGDTSGYVSQALGIYAFETLFPLAPGSPLCLAHSNDVRYDGLEIALKGGQNGNEKYFASVLEGKLLI